MIKIISISITIIILSSFMLINAYAVDNNCMIIVWNFFDLPIALGCIEDRLDALENASPFTDQTTASNLGSGHGVFASEVGNDLQFKSLVAGGNVTITNNATTITINSSGGGSESTICDNVGTGNPLHKVGTNCSAFSIIAGGGITITNTTDDYTLDRTRSFNMIGDVYQTTTKTNLATSYVDVYVGAFDEENKMIIDCSNRETIGLAFQISYQWDFVGAGTDQIRWVDAGNNANVLKEDTTISADQDSRTILFAKPAWCTSSVVFIEMQAKSSNGTNDPIARGYTIWAN